MRALNSIAVAAMLTFGATVAHSATIITVIEGIPGDGANDPFPRNLVYSDEDYRIDSAALYKCDDVQGDADEPVCGRNVYTDAGSSGEFTVEFNSGFGGEWSWVGDGLAPHYMVVKAGNAYAIWDLMGELSGFWSTEGLDRAGVSHISFYNTGIPEVPLPASAVLLLAGLGGLAFMRRRRS